MARKKSSPKSEFIFVLVFAGIFMIMGIGVGGRIGKIVFTNTVITSSWAKVPCKIASIDIDTQKSKRSSTGKRRKGARSSKSRHYVQVEYTYDYDGRQYTGDKYSHLDRYPNTAGKFLSTRVKELRSQINPFCYVNKKTPEDSILDPMITPSSKTGLIVCLVFVGMSVCMMSKGWKTYKKQAGK